MVCGYCGQQYQVATPPPPPVPGVVPMHFPKAPSRGASTSLIVGIAMTVVAVGAAASLRLFLQSAATTSHRTGARPSTPGSKAAVASEEPRWWFSRGEPALARVSGDTAQVVGMVGWLNGTTELTALDGATGKLLWHVPAPRDSNVYAEGEVILAYDAAKRVIRYDSRTGKVRWTINVADYVHDITFGSGCASLRFGKPLGIDSETGTPKACVPARPALLGVEKGKPQDVTMKRGDIELVGSVQLDDKPVNPAPPRFAVTASRAGKELWRSAPTTLEPFWQIAGFTRSVVLTHTGVFVFGRNSSDHRAHWLSLDVASGATQYDSDSNAKVDSDIWLATAGPHVYVNHDQRLEVYVAATGKLAWQIAEP